MDMLNTDDWEILKRFLPAGWATMATKLGALRRKRKFPSAESLLRVLLIHLADGKSLRTTAAYAKACGLCEVNDGALLHRLKASGEWFRWMSKALLEDLRYDVLPMRRNFRVRAVDASVVSEPGSTGTDWRLHYCFQLNGFRCDTFSITSPRVTEAFSLYSARQGDLMVGDRAYCQRKGIVHVLGQGGHVLVRFHSTNLPLFDRKGRPWSVLERLRTLSAGQVGDWDVWFRRPDGDGSEKGRLCALRKSPEAIEAARRRILRKAKKKGHAVRPETLEHAEYVSVFCTADRRRLSAEEVLCLYRGRWQIELVFKRLKGIVGLGHLPKRNPDSCVAWLYGKMLVALLAERFRREAEFFSPWGYPMRSPGSTVGERE
jgi:hypothetical protein